MPASKDAAHARGIDGEGFFHEDVTAPLDGILQVDGPKGGRRGEKDDAARGNAVDGLAVAVHAEELTVLGHAPPLGELFGEVVGGSFEAIRKNVGQGPEGGRALGGQGLSCGSAAAAAAADQGDFDGVVLGRMDAGQVFAGQGCAGHDGSGLFQKGTP